MIADAHAHDVIVGVAGLEAPPSLQTRLSTLVQIRWLAIAGQTATIAIVQATIGGLPMMPVVLTVGASMALNLALTALPGARRRGADSAWHLAFDIVQLAVLVGLTGGLSNPFAIFLMAPVAVAAATLPVRPTTLLALAAVIALSVVAEWHMPLPWDGAPMEFPPLYLFAGWAALSVGVLSVALFTWRIAEEARRLAAAYAHSRLALEKEQRVAEVGALAAAVAHELNTPLGTVSLIARELEGELRGTALHAEIETLISQADRCRDTLARLTRGRERAEALENETVSFPSLVELAAEPYTGTIPILFDHHASTPAPWVERNPAVLHGLGNLIQNATQFAASRVEVDTSWCGGRLAVRIADDGSGFPPHLLDRLGEPYVSARDIPEGHLGLGIFIAVTLLTRIGATVTFDNPPGGGAEVLVRWSDRHGVP